jgi:hypothetical protein
MNVMPGMQAAEHLGSGQREAVGDASVVGFLHSAGGDAEAEKTGLKAAKLGVHPGVVFPIAQAEFAQLCVVDSAGRAANCADAADGGVAQPFQQYALSDHARGSASKNVHTQLHAAAWLLDGSGADAFVQHNDCE